MVDADAQHGGGGSHWAAKADPDYRERVVTKMKDRLVEIYKLESFASQVEEKAFHTAQSMEEYLCQVARALLHVETRENQRQQILRRQKMQMEHQLQNAGLAGARMAQSPGSQLQSANFVGCNPMSKVMHGQQFLGPSTQQRLMVTNQQDPRTSQLQMGMQRYNTYEAEQVDVAAVQIGHHGSITLEPQQMAAPQPQTTVAQQCGLPCQCNQIAAAMGSSVNVDWREDMFQKITSLRDAHYSDLMELDQKVICLSEEQILSLPKEQADRHKKDAMLKDAIGNSLSFLQLEKGSIPKDMKEFCDKKMYVLKLVDIHRRMKKQTAQMSAPGQLQNCTDSTMRKCGSLPSGSGDSCCKKRKT